MRELYEERPFKVRNADEYDLWDIPSLFVSPMNGLATPFDYANTIVKGRMGSGKTMFLRANHAFYQFRLLAAIATGESPILPIFLRLNAFQQYKDANEVYRNIILKIVEELASAYLNLQNTKHMARVHFGVRALSPDLLANVKLADSMTHLAKLGSEEFLERISTDLGLKGGIKPEFIELSAEFKKTKLTEVKQKPNPGIKDVEDAYKTLLQDQNGCILLLIDKAGSLDRTFFKGKDNDSPFEILMNQLRTMESLRTKIAIYPNSYQDVLTETRYGDAVLLEDNIHSVEDYKRYRNRAYHLVNNYINPAKSYDGKQQVNPDDLLNTNSESVFGDCLEQLVNASNGNMRRLIQLLDASMEMAYSDHGGESGISLEHVNDTLVKHAQETVSQYTEPDQDFLANIAKACRNRSTYKFEFPYMSNSLNKFTSRSEEYNLVNVVRFGTGRSSTIYAFDYSYCVANLIPTHYISGSEKIDRSRSLEEGVWISRVARLSDEIIDHTSIALKIEGEISYVREGVGFIRGDDEKEYFFQPDSIISDDTGKQLVRGRRVRYIPLIMQDNRLAQAIEVL